MRGRRLYLNDTAIEAMKEAREGHLPQVTRVDDLLT